MGDQLHLPLSDAVTLLGVRNSEGQGTTGDCPDGSVLRGLDLLRSWRTGREP